MRRGLLFSAGLHAVVALLTVAVFPSIAPELPPIPPNIPVDLVTIGEITNIKKIDRVEEEPKPEEDKPAEPDPEPMRQAALPPAPEPVPLPEPELAPPPAPALKVEPEKKAEEKKAEEKKPEPPKPKPAPPAPPRKKEQAFDANKIAALLNKLPPKEKASEEGEEKKVVTGPQKTEAVGEATGMTASAMDAIRAQMQRCWTLPAGAPNPRELIVRVRFGLNEDGSLSRTPELVDRARLAVGDPYYRTAAENAVRALHVCTPFKLPPGVWTPDYQDIEMTFDPRAMLGG